MGGWESPGKPIGAHRLSPRGPGLGGGEFGFRVLEHVIARGPNDHVLSLVIVGLEMLP